MLGNTCHLSVMRLTTFNVNGIRASLEKGLRDYLLSCDADVICLQEVKAEASQCDLSFLPPGYSATWNSAQKKGYSGTLTLCRQPVLTSSLGFGIEHHDKEGRVVTTELADSYVVNVYTPNAKAELARLEDRLDWDAALLRHVQKLELRKPVLLCGDLNCSHQDIDLANPKANRFSPGFSDEERASFNNYIRHGLLDVLRVFEPEATGRYTWWTQRIASARRDNIGWRLDYWLASASLRPRLHSLTIRSEIYGSDHCPVECVLLPEQA
jgi:exodeoxyribonuclease III